MEETTFGRPTGQNTGTKPQKVHSIEYLRVLASAWQPEADVTELLRAQSWAARNQYRGDKDLATGLRATYIL